MYAKIGHAIDWMKTMTGNIKTGTAEANTTTTITTTASASILPEKFTLSDAQPEILNGVYLKQNVKRNGTV